MKFCRFALVAEPSTVRSGIAYEGRIYETDGTNAIGIHEASDIQLLAPVGRAPSVRIFRQGHHTFDYANPGTMFGPGQVVSLPPEAERVGYAPAIAVVVGGSGTGVPIDVADELVLGLALAHVFTTLRGTGGKALDAGFTIGPALVTPDELSSDSLRPASGIAYGDTITVHRNGVDVLRYDLADLRPTVADCIATASQSAPLVEGDLLILPLVELDLTPEAGDEMKLTAPKMGALVSVLAKPV